MTMFKRKTTNRKRVIFFALLFFSCLFTLGLVKEVLNRYQIDKEIKDMEADVARLEEENQALNDLLSSWSGSNQLEKEARIKLGLQRPGEKVVVVLRDEDNSTDSAGEENVDYRKKGNSVIATEKTDFNPRNWWQYLFQ